MTHVHIGQNIPGYGAESDVYCADDLGSAVTDLKTELERQRDFYYERCANDADEGCMCAWCKVGDLVAADLADESPVWPYLAEQGQWGGIYNPPEGPSIHIWVCKAQGEAPDCEIWEEQENN